jgi:hypothetical protein
VALTGTPLVIVLAMLFAAMFAATLLLWTRLPRVRGARSGLRFAMLLADQVLAVLLVGVLANDAGGFYSSWSQLLGHSGHGQIIARGRHGSGGPVTVSPTGGPQPGSTPPELHGRITPGADPAWATRAQWPTRGRLESVTITGAASQLTSHAYVYLPPQYFQAAFARTRFPAVEVLTGYPGHDGDLIGSIDVPRALLTLIDSGAVPPMVLVMMRPAVTYPRDTECTDVPAGPQVQTFFDTDVPMAAAHVYRVRPTAWGAFGISTGGYCAVKLAMMRPGQFNAAVSLSGYYTALRDATTGDLWGGSSALRDLNDPEWRLQHLPAPPVSVLTTVGSFENGPDGQADMRRFLALVKPPMQASSIVVQGGYHSDRLFARQLPRTLQWLGKRLQPATQD